MGTQKTGYKTRAVALIVMLVILLSSGHFVNYGQAAFNGRKTDSGNDELNIGVRLNPDGLKSSVDADNGEPVVALTKETLRGIEGIWVFVTKRDIKAEKYGLIANIIQSKVEQRLQENNIKVLTKEQYKQSKKVGILCIDILPLISEEMGYSAVGINIALMQNVLLTGNDVNRICQATTWEQRTVALCDMDGLREIPESVIGFIDSFIKDFRGANSGKPLKHKTPQEQTTPPDQIEHQETIGPPRSDMV